MTRTLAKLLAVILTAGAVWVGLAVGSPAVASPVETLIEEGIKLHDKGDYQAAILKYKVALSIDDEHPLAWYELALTYSVIGEYEKCIDATAHALEQRSSIEGSIYAMQGTCYSLWGKPEQALGAYRKGLERQPNNPALHLNIAVTLANTGQLDEAVQHLKQAIEAQPTYPTPYYYLALIFQHQNNRVPSFYFYLRYAMLDPNSARSATVAKQLAALVNYGIRSSEEQKASLNLYMSKDNPEGDFSALELALSMAAVNTNMQNPGMSAADQLAEISLKFIRICSDLQEGDYANSFTWQWAVKPVLALHAKGGSEAFIYHLAGIAQMAGAAEWLQGHQAEIAQLGSLLSELE